MWQQFVESFWLLAHSFSTRGAWDLAFNLFPFVVLLELPFYALVVGGMLRFGLCHWRAPLRRLQYPSVSCLITCYSEGDDVRKTISSLVNQRYAGCIQIIPIIDGAIKNSDTLHAALSEAKRWEDTEGREVTVLPKWQRGGRVSSLNAGLTLATGEVVMALDGDTSFDNDMVENATRHFDDPLVAGVAGNLRVRNQGKNMVTKMQGLEYMLSISGGKTGLSEFNIVNNISGAFGVFRTSLVRHLGGWDAGTAEDLDMTLRIKQYFGRHGGMRIKFEPHAMGHTDAPESWRVFFKQRLRWDGDMYYLFVRKYRFNLRPSLLGWPNFLFTLVNGLLMQLVLPYLIVGSLAMLLFIQPLGIVLGTLAFVYLGYLLLLLAYYLVYLATVSERIRLDLSYLPYLPLFPLFAFVTRVHSGYAILVEALTHSHLDSSMAPNWVLRKNKF
ncbi:MAG: glycosyltransferase family 2 protein [Comamonas sp.]|jgi:cellulose synthase/poly-beta-1,6-N-acetylglucosamine synthase-like glycosyltransferase|nr:glycosyltransferase family 2 protein [Comamonas sp.]